MPTPPPRDDNDSMQFRGPTLEEAIALAEQSLGARVRVVAANRIRRGGIGGFFASDLGVEVTVALDDETIEQALERLVSETAADERHQWMSAQSAVAAPAARSGRWEASTSTARPAPTVSSTAAASAAAVTTLESLMPSAPARTEPTTMVRVEQIIEELQHLTAAPLFGGGATRYGGRRPIEPMPTEPPAAPAVEAVVDALADAIGVQRSPVAAAQVAAVEAMAADPSGTPALRFEPSAGGSTVDLAVDAFVARARPGTASAVTSVTAPMTATTMTDSTMSETVAMTEHETSAATEPWVDVDAPDTIDDSDVAVAAAAYEVTVPAPSTRVLHAAAEIDVAPTARPASSSAPSRRQVELAIAATDQLMESLKREDGVKRLSVRVVLRTGDQREVEAAAEWEAS